MNATAPNLELKTQDPTVGSKLPERRLRAELFLLLHPDAVDVIDHRYNCLPDASPLPVQKGFSLDGVEIRALHITSPGRRTPEG